tara:strand:+ start:27756 stop:27944 length:189 start_codon:yes stop_codon:yes gene_type:complete
MSHEIRSAIIIQLAKKDWLNTYRASLGDLDKAREEFNRLRTEKLCNNLIGRREALNQLIKEL